MLQVEPSALSSPQLQPSACGAAACHLSVTTTQHIFKGLCFALRSACQKAASAWWILTSCVVAIAIGSANRVRQDIVVILLSVEFHRQFDVTLLKNAIKGS
jgi:hypothetical protein